MLADHIIRSLLPSMVYILYEGSVDFANSFVLFLSIVTSSSDSYSIKVASTSTKCGITQRVLSLIFWVATDSF